MKSVELTCSPQLTCSDLTALAMRSLSHREASHPRNQPVNVGGSCPCFTTTTDVSLSRPDGSVSMYFFAAKVQILYMIFYFMFKLYHVNHVICSGKHAAKPVEGLKGFQLSNYVEKCFKEYVPAASHQILQTRSSPPHWHPFQSTRRPERLNQGSETRITHQPPTKVRRYL